MYVSCFYSLLSSHSPFCLFVCLFPVALSVCSYHVKKAVVQYAYTTGHNCCLSVFQQYKDICFLLTSGAKSHRSIEFSNKMREAGLNLQ